MSLVKYLYVKIYFVTRKNAIFKSIIKINEVVLDKLDIVVAQWHQQKPMLETGPMALIGRLLRISKHIETRIVQCHRRLGLSLGEFDVLAALRRSAKQSCLTPSELIDALLLTSGAMTNRLDKLCEKDLVSRSHSEQDRRSVTVQLTDAGRDLIDQAIQNHVQILNELINGLNEEDKTLLDATFKKWLTQFEPQC